jgi:hypothetical protein
VSLLKRVSSFFLAGYHVLRACTSGMGLLFLPIEIYTSVTDNPSPLDLAGFIFAGLALGFAIYFIDGQFITGFLRNEISWRIPSTNTTIEILFGDIFKQETLIAIGVNDRFDSVVDNKIISKESLHGQAITRFWKNSEEWRAKINEELDSKNLLLSSRQAIGTCVDLSANGKEFLFFAVSRTDECTNVTSSNAENLIIAVKGMLQRARIVCAGRLVSVPLVGSGLARVGLHSDGILHLILAAVTEECKSAHITRTIRIVLRPGTEREVNLLQIMRTWS